MKIILTIIVGFTLLIITNPSVSQVNITTAVDFTVTDTDGNTHNLFTYLDDGKWVLIDFFFTTCGPCQATAPLVSFAYTHFGCNSSDLIVLGIDDGDNNAQVIQFENTYGVEYPAASGMEGGGNAVVSAYGPAAFPTVILIKPNKQIVEQDIWPIPSAQTLLNVITGYGLQSVTCPSVSINEHYDTDRKEDRISVYPNPAQDVIHIHYDNISKGDFLILTDLTGKKVLSVEIQDEYDNQEIPISLSGIRPGTYFLILENNGNRIARSVIIHN